MSCYILIKNSITSYSSQSYSWDIILKHICDSFLSYINVFYNIHIIDEEPGTIRHYNFTQLKSFIDYFHSFNYDIKSFTSSINNSSSVFSNLELDHIFPLINITSNSTLPPSYVQKIHTLFKYCSPFIKDSNILNTIYNIDEVLSSSVENNLTTTFETLNVSI